MLLQVVMTEQLDMSVRQAGMLSIDTVQITRCCSGIFLFLNWQTYLTIVILLILTWIWLLVS